MEKAGKGVDTIMIIKIKDNIDLEELRKFGFKKGIEWAEAGERCLKGIGYKYQHEWWHKFLMDEEDETKIAYISKEYDIPSVQISIGTEKREIYIEVAVEGTYNIGGSDLDVVTETIMRLTEAGFLEIKD